MSSPGPLHWLATQPIWWALQTQTEWVIFEPARTHHLGLKAQNFTNAIFTFGAFYLKAVYNSCKSQRLLQIAKFLFMYSFTHTNIVFLFKHQPTKIVLPDKVFQWWYFFLFLRESFANIPPTFLISCEIKDSKIFWTVHLKPFIRYQGKNLNLFWICYFQFFFHYLVQPNQAIHFLFHIICIIRIRLWIF